MKLDLLTDGLNRPVLVTNAGDNSGRLFILERRGIILIYKNNALLPAAFLDISGFVNSGGGEQGLLGLAFDPDYEVNGFFYVTYIDGGLYDADMNLARYSVSVGDADIADPDSAIILLTIPKVYKNHNGGMLAFGPDGYLYQSTGDGGGGYHSAENSQDITKLLGKILRLDVSAIPYSIPPTNPYYNSADPDVEQEIWSMGFRNPWRYSFDRSTGDLYIGDVGQMTMEEVDFQPASSSGGEDYGWNTMEGSLCYDPPAGCNTSGLEFPVTEYDHSDGCAIAGGYVYRGNDFPDLQGVYLYSDFCNGDIRGLKMVNGSWQTHLLLDTPFNISSFGQDELGEVYVVDYAGAVYKISYHPVTTTHITSSGSRDSHIRETSENSNSGAAGTIMPTQSVFYIGDDARDRQYRAVLSFNTGSLPDSAVVIASTLRIRLYSIIGTNPFNTHGKLYVSLARPFFGAVSGLEGQDFQAAPTLANIRYLRMIAANPVWYTAALPYSSLPQINTTGPTQFRLQFQLDDNDNMHADYMRFLSGDVADTAARPQLIITYFEP